MLFLRRGGFIEATLPATVLPRLATGMSIELLCTYRFTGEEALTKKAHQLQCDEHDDGVSKLEGT